MATLQAKVMSSPRGTEVEAGACRNGATPEVELEGRRIPVKLEGWRIESQQEARKSAAKPG